MHSIIRIENEEVSKSVSISGRKPLNGFCFLWGVIKNIQFFLLGDAKFAARRPGISILHQVAVDALTARVVGVALRGKQLKHGWKGKETGSFPGDVKSTFHGHHQGKQNNKTCLVE